MFVSKLSEVDFFLSQVNILMTKVNEKLDECPEDSRSAILPRIYHIVSELEWTMSLSKKDSICVKEEEVDCTYSGALSPAEELGSSYSDSDIESLSWDNQDFYKLYYEEDADDENEEDCDEEKSEKDDHGPIQFSVSSHHESFNPKENSEATKCDDVAENEAHVGEDADEEKKFISSMSATIQKLAPDSTYHVTRPRQFRVDLSQVNSRFLGNIPRPKEYPTLGCMTEAESEEKILTGMGWIQKPWRSQWQWGYMTDCGVVPVPAEPVYGHVWSATARDWILHATPDDGTGPPPPPRQRGGRFRG